MSRECDSDTRADEAVTASHEAKFRRPPPAAYPARSPNTKGTPMKTFMTAALVAALAISAAAFGQEPGAPGKLEPNPTKSEPVKQAGKKVTLEDLGEMLTAMGYEPKPFNNKDGKLMGYDLTFQYDGWTIYGSFEVQSDGRIWLYGGLAPVVDESTPPAVLVAMLEASDKAFPSHLLYSSKTKKFTVFLPITNGNVTPASLRGSIETYSKSVKTTLNVYSTAKEKAEAIAKEKAAGQPQK